MGPPERNKRRIVVVNTNHCRSEIDTIQYVINKYGYREANSNQDGNLLWYGLALRDHDIDIIKGRTAMINRYPLMDVSTSLALTLTALRQEEHFLRDHQQTAALLPGRLPLHA